VIIIQSGTRALFENKMKVLIVANLYPTKNLKHYGVFVKSIEKNLVKSGIDTRRIVLPDFGFGFKGYSKFYYTVFKELLNTKDLVYVHYVSHSILPVLLAKIFNKKLKVVLNYHGSDAFPDEKHGFFAKTFRFFANFLANKNAIGIVFPSHYFRKQFLAKFNVSIPTYVSPSGGIKLTFPCGSELERKDGILFAGRMIRGKGAVLAAKTIKKAKDINPCLQATFIGDGEELGNVKSLLSGVGNVEYFNSLPQELLFEKMKSASVFLFPSTRKGESLGLVLIEAMAQGCIPIAMKNGAVSEILNFSPMLLIADNENDFINKTLAILALSAREKSILLSKIRSALLKYEAKRVGKELAIFLKECS